MGLKLLSVIKSFHHTVPLFIQLQGRTGIQWKDHDTSLLIKAESRRIWHHGDSFSSQILTETWNHRIAEVGRVWFIWSSPHCTPLLLNQHQLQHLVWCPDNCWVSPVLFPHLQNHLIKGVQVHQAWLALCESMLTNPDHVFVPCVPGNGFQDWLFHHLPRDYGEIVQTVVLWVFLFVLPEERSGIYCSCIHWLCLVFLFFFLFSGTQKDS